MFSEKVMETFRNPKHIGFIKDADGIGRVGNVSCGDIMWVYIKVKKENGREIIEDVKVKTFGCLPPDEKVVLGEGWQSIALVKEGQEVVNGEGIKDAVEKFFEIPYDGKMLRFVPLISHYNSISLTPEHPALALKRSSVARGKTKGGKSKWLRVDKSKLKAAEPQYIKAGELETGDYLVFSCFKGVSENSESSESLLRLLGYYLSEGYPIAKGNATAFAFHKKEKRLIKEVEQLVWKAIGKKTGQRTRGNVTEVYFCSKKLTDELVRLSGKGARTKVLSEEIMKLPPEKQMHIIKAFWAGDGDTTTRRKGNSPTYRLATASEKLAIQFQEILARNGIFASITKRKRKKHYIEGREVTGSALYVVKYKTKRKHNFVHAGNGYFLVPIKQIIETKYKGYVYNLHTANKPNSYLAKGFVVHNCVAAIATASMVGEMAIGKTLDEALKISHDEIAKELGGLPKEKMHCSALSQQGLRAAIEDYRNKKGKAD